MRTARNILCGVVAVLLVACASHTILAYVDLLSKPYNSAPASVALLLLLPYGLAVVACVVAIAIMDKKISNNKFK